MKFQAFITSYGHLTCVLLCFLQRNSKVVVIDDYQDVPTQSESALMKALTKNPVSVAIEAGGRDFQHYQGVGCLPLPKFNSHL